MTDETWKPIPGYEGLYEVSDQGQVRSLRGWRNLPVPYVLTQHVTAKGYRKVGLCKAGKPRVWFVHMLVLLAFSGPRNDGLQTRHMDGNPANNTLSNLRYGTAKQNIQDQLVHGTHSTASNTHCPSNHPYSGENLYVSPRGERRCRTCARDQAAKRRAAAEVRSTDTTNETGEDG